MAVAGIASVDVKADEVGILALAEQLAVPFLTYPAGRLQVWTVHSRHPALWRNRSAWIMCVSARRSARRGRAADFWCKRRHVRARRLP